MADIVRYVNPDAAAGGGTDNPGSGLYSDDIIGTARSSTWDIGAFEYVAPAATGGFMTCNSKFWG